MATTNVPQVVAQAVAGAEQTYQAFTQKFPTSGRDKYTVCASHIRLLSGAHHDLDMLLDWSNIGTDSNAALVFQGQEEIRALINKIRIYHITSD